MTPKKDLSCNLEKNDCGYPKKVGPLSHLSTMHWEIAKGIPLIPLPAKPPSLEIERRDKSISRACKGTSSRSGENTRTPSRRLISSKDTERSNDGSNLISNPHFNCSFISDAKQSGQEKFTNNATSSSSEHHQRRMELWKGSANQIGMDPSQTLKDTKTTLGEEWIEYWDEEVETSYYYNVATGEASWYNPDETN